MKITYVQRPTNTVDADKQLRRIQRREQAKEAKQPFMLQCERAIEAWRKAGKSS